MPVEPDAFTEFANSGACLAGLFRVEFSFAPGQRFNCGLDEFVYRPDKTGASSLPDSSFLVGFG